MSSARIPNNRLSKFSNKNILVKAREGADAGRMMRRGPKQRGYDKELEILACRAVLELFDSPLSKVLQSKKEFQKFRWCYERAKNFSRECSDLATPPCFGCRMDPIPFYCFKVSRLHRRAKTL